MKYEIKYKKIDSKEFIKTHLNNIIDTVKNEGEIDTEVWAEFIDDVIKKENSIIKEIINRNRMINIKPDDEGLRVNIEFDDSIIEKGNTYRGFTKKELGEFIECLQLVHSQLENIEVI